MRTATVVVVMAMVVVAMVVVAMVVVVMVAIAQGVRVAAAVVLVGAKVNVDGVGWSVGGGWGLSVVNVYQWDPRGPSTAYGSCCAASIPPYNQRLPYQTRLLLHLLHYLHLLLLFLCVRQWPCRWPCRQRRSQ
jgi:hypothetical protein